ncbi:SRPBCC domain-containing protein [Paenibacillus psychroresistens]|uniref:SRPBCC domain-containing protein n=1 Tax=Paenibacillus psychroresistens TaxID=1778678 RepID=A0A6B8RSY4_9BACL|nr:SRPBCC domain-containing protein [Paenibacillus psychroresistens]QGQ99571.1 SRPBCC domain-containing protein [Paenibacillus psychroresistens]
MPENEFVISRTFKASRELMFKVWSELEHFKKWWGPTGFALESSKLDFRPGGIFHYCMRAPDGFEMWGKFVYHEIVAPEKIVFVNSFSDPEGNIVPAPFEGKIPLEIKNTLTLTENEGQTTLTLRGGPINASEEERSFYSGMFDSMNQGFTGTFDQLEAYLATFE